MSPNNQLNNVSTEGIRAELDQIIRDTSEWMERAAILLVELRRRGEKHPLMQSNILRFFKGIAAGNLSAEAILAVGGNRNLVRALGRLPVNQQTEVAKNRPVQVVEMTPEGEEIVTDRSIAQLSQSAIDRVFGPKGLRSLQEQREMLGPKRHQKRIDGVIVDISARKIVIGAKHISPAELIGPLKALGYRITLIDEQAPKPEAD